MPILPFVSVVVMSAVIHACGGTASTGDGNSSTSGGAAGGSPSTGGGVGGSGAVGGGPTYSCNGKQVPIPINHRPSVESCPTSNVAVPCRDGGAGPCGGEPCMSDVDCRAGLACTCDGTAFGWSHRSMGNTCVQSNCRTDADCPSGYCSPSAAPGASFYGVTGFFCHTCDDTCSSDSDCSGDFGPGYCAYQSSGAWACSYGSIAG